MVTDPIINFAPHDVIIIIISQPAPGDDSYRRRGWRRPSTRACTLIFGKKGSCHAPEFALFMHRVIHIERVVPQWLIYGRKFPSDLEMGGCSHGLRACGYENR
jgi:hypothetical protein